MAKILAAADIGSNTAHLLVAEYSETGLNRMVNESEWIALGQIVATQGRIPPETEAHLVRALKSFKAKARQQKAEAFYVFGTEAIRSASNCAEVVGRIKKELGIAVDIISPLREAQLSLYGTSIDCGFGPNRLLIEVGGGSAQMARVDYDQVIESVSVPIGTGRIVAESNLHSPVLPSQLENAQAYVAACLQSVDLARTPVFRQVVCSGGVIRGLWRALHPDQDIHLHRKEIEYLMWATERLTVTKIGKRFGVKPKRAATLFPGALVYFELMEKFGVVNITVSEYGVREGAVLELANGRLRS